MEKDTILCPRKGEDGKVCQFRLQSQFKFCPACGTNVNPAWFQQDALIVRECDNTSSQSEQQNEREIQTSSKKSEDDINVGIENNCKTEECKPDIGKAETHISNVSTDIGKTDALIVRECDNILSQSEQQNEREIKTTSSKKSEDDINVGVENSCKTEECKPDKGKAESHISNVSTDIGKTDALIVRDCDNTSSQSEQQNEREIKTTSSKKSEDDINVGVENSCKTEECKPDKGKAETHISNVSTDIGKTGRESDTKNKREENQNLRGRKSNIVIKDDDDFPFNGTKFQEIKPVESGNMREISKLSEEKKEDSRTEQQYKEVDTSEKGQDGFKKKEHEIDNSCKSIHMEKSRENKDVKKNTKKEGEIKNYSKHEKPNRRIEHEGTNVDGLRIMSTSTKEDRKIQKKEKMDIKEKQKKLKVHFHAFLAPNVDFVAEKDKLCVQIDLYWNPDERNFAKDEYTKEVEMKLISSQRSKKGKLRFWGEIELEKYSSETDIPYFYCFRNRQSSKRNRDEEPEFFFQQYSPYNNKRRILNISNWEDDSFHQFDGFIYRKDKGFVAEVKRYWKEATGKLGLTMDHIEALRREGEFALTEYLPDIICVMKTEQDPCKIKAMFKEYIQVFKGGVKDHFMSSLDQYDPKSWAHFIFDNHLIRGIKVLETQEERDENQKLLKTLLMVNLLVRLDVQQVYKDHEVMEIIFQSLLLSPSTERKFCPQLDYLHQCLETPIKEVLKTSLVRFMKYSATVAGNRCQEKRNPAWLIALPIVDFLDGSLKPFDTLDYGNFQDKKDEWWLRKEFETEKEELKRYEWSRPPADLLRMLIPLFKLDTKAQRGFMACISLENLELVMKEETILLEIKLATLLHYFENVKSEKEMDILLNCMDTVRRKLAKMNCSTERQQNIDGRQFEIFLQKCLSILSRAITNKKFVSYKRNLISLFHCTMLSLSAYERTNPDSDKVKTSRNQLSLKIDNVFSKTGNDLANCDFALSILEFVQQSDLTAAWEKKCLHEAEKYINSEKFSRSGLFEVYNKCNTEIRNTDLKRMVETAVSKCIEYMSESELSTLYVSPDTLLISKIISKIWKTDSNLSDELILKKALTSTIYPKCIKAFLSNTNIFQNVDQIAKENLQKSLEILKSLFKDLKVHNVSVCVMEFIISEKDMLFAVADFFQNHFGDSHPLRRSELENILLCREKDLKALKEVYKTVVILRIFFRVINKVSGIQIGEIDDAKLESWSLNPIKSVCSLTEENPVASQYKPDVTLFKDVRLKLQFIIEDISIHYESKTFHEVLKQTSKEHRDSKELEFDGVVQKILKPTKDTWDDLCKEMKAGSIIIHDIENYHFHEFSDREMFDELKLMNMGIQEDWINERIIQLQRFKMFSKTVSTAKLLLDVKEKCRVSGSFEKLEIISNSDTRKDIQLSSLKNEIERFNQELIDITDRQKKCIDSFLKSYKLVEWLQSAQTGGIKDIKIYADLALLSVEGDEHVGRVTNLHSAVIGYSAVIYGNMNGEFEMLNNWRVVWDNLEKDNSLPKKLEESNKYLNWFIEIKESHGSVEVTSLKQVDAIKDRGIFNVGFSRSAAQNEHQLRLEDVIWLHVPAGMSLEGREYSLGEMADLQSRLMLVTGKADSGRESIERFTSIFDNVTRLGKVFVRLHASGCILFKYWRFEFHCNPNVGCSVMIRTHEQSVVKGTNTQQQNEYNKEAQSNVNEYIRQIAHFLEKCYEEWIRYITEKRKCFYPLNFYTVDQMVLLQEELARYRNGNKTSRFLSPLLSVVKSQCLLNPDLDDAIDRVQEKLLTIEQTSDMEQVSEKTSHAEAIKKFLQSTDKAGISRKHALRAIQSKAFSIENIKSGLLWCLRNDENDDDVDDDEVEEEKEKDKSAYVKDDASKKKKIMENSTINDIIKNCMNEMEENLRQEEITKVISNLQSTWKKFLNCASSSATDFLSIDHLGMILDILYEKDTCTVIRPFFDPLKRGKPNLIVCPQNDVISMVLTLYMGDQDLPLPTKNEVLQCTGNTSSEEVDIFFRRALFQSKSDKNERIFCLMNADKLQYDISENSLTKVTEYIKYANGEYKLVIICSIENEYRSPMISAFDKYRTPKIAVAEMKKVQTYLKNKYTPADVRDTAVESDPIRNCVRVVKSRKAGLGKTLYKTRLSETLLKKIQTVVRDDFPLSVTIPLSQKDIEVSEISNKLLQCTLPKDVSYPRIFHIDIANGVESYVGSMLFNILILGSLVDVSGYVFHRSEKDLFIIETTIPIEPGQNNDEASSAQLLSILPSVRCISPREFLQSTVKEIDNNDDEQMIGFDTEKFQSDEWQRPYHYLVNFEKTGKIPAFDKAKKEENKSQCLSLLTKHCCIKNPSWAELRNFVHFLNTQLEDFESSVFCSAYIIRDLPGFPIFVLRFLIQMSKDFATRSLEMSEEHNIDNCDSMDLEDVAPENSQNSSRIDGDLERFQMRRKWETSAHPYLFFNPDQHTMTFIGFNIDKQNRHLIDKQTGLLLEKNIMSKQLWDALKRNDVPLQENFDELSRDQKIQRLCRVVGNDSPHDPDSAYELTTDNVKKMMAIYMRFRCNIPVIIMGETGCGKTCLVKFLCALQCPANSEMNTMSLMKVHGGTTKEHILQKVKEAESLAELNCERYGKHIITVLFFDEANTTEAVGCVKEIMCDERIDGKPLSLNTNLKLVAACNPYRKHSDEMIKRLEKAGLGYHVNSDKTDDKFGSVPMRHLVYRVQPLPESLLHLVWDFGQLSSDVENLYIKQMVQRCVKEETLPAIDLATVNAISKILAASQEFMRKQMDECSFVSLRDVERTLKVFGWIYQKNEIFLAMEKVKLDEERHKPSLKVDKVVEALLLALGICYHSSLKSRDEYRNHIASFFVKPLQLPGGGKRMEMEIRRCHMAFLQHLKLNDNIAKNLALRENFFMMVVCVELRIPLFLVGKPGSSKSLSKSILDHNMQGRTSESDLFKCLKQVQLISFQCSPLATADGILKTFKQASSLQKSKDLEKFVSVVVLDEVGLAEDSPRMPLKALHPLLEDGCPDDEESEEYKKVSFIGISNWALDPAKMNRGILLQREIPDEKDLIESAKGICRQEDIYTHIDHLVPPLAEAFIGVFELARDNKTLFKSAQSSERQLRAREFFGLRDFYSLVKMICEIALEKHRCPNDEELITAIKRNFGGLESLDSVKEFGKHLPSISAYCYKEEKTDIELLKDCLQFEENRAESRYVLLLTENYGALNFLETLMGGAEKYHILFGSSFPRDQEYIEICRNINRIKVYMETGKTVVLLNLENLYESLYDALNQYYMESSTDRYIDLGLGTHRVKCKVHKKFRLVIVADKRVVYEEFPIPLINRMEKHFLTMKGMLTPDQLKLSEDLDQWARKFSKSSNGVRVNDVFIGYNKDTAAGVIYNVWESYKQENNHGIAFKEKVMKTAKEFLLWSCTPDSVLRLTETELRMDAEKYTQIYFKTQCHESLCDFLLFRENHRNFGEKLMQITTHSKLMSEADKEFIEKNLSVLSNKVSLLSLKAFDTEQQFSNQISETLRKGKKLLLVQCDTGDENSNLIECARHCVQREIIDKPLDICVLFLVHLPRVSKSFFSGFQTGEWRSLHIDELRATLLPCMEDMMTKSISTLLKESIQGHKSYSRQNGSEILTSQERYIDLKAILINCVHPALSSIIELDGNRERSIKRVKFIFKELNQNEELTEGGFCHGLMKHIVTMLSKEDANEESFNDNWLREGSKFSNVNKSGTLRGSCQKIIEEKIIPVMANIVAFLDTNNNLSILENVENGLHWTAKLWFGIFNSMDREMFEQIKVPRVTNTGIRDVFTSVFPFSWLIYQSVEKLLLLTSENDIGQTVEKLFMDSDVGKMLIGNIHEEEIIQATTLYMTDFIQMSYRALSSEEEQVVCKFLHAFYEERMSGKEKNFVNVIICIHNTFKYIKPKLDIFSEVALLVQAGENSFHENLKGDVKIIDILAVRYVLELMKPDDVIDTSEGQTHWIADVQRYRPVVEHLIYGDIETTPAREELISDIKEKWTKIVLLKLFIQNLCIDTSRREELKAQSCMILWMIFEGMNSCNFKERTTLDEIEKFLQASNRKVLKEYLGKFVKCGHCERQCESSPPVVLPCGHRLCRENCFSNIKQMKEEKTCLVNDCFKQIPEHFDENETTEDQREQMKLFMDYQEKCNRFYMQVVSQLCFEKSSPPSEGVMQHLLHLVMYKKTIPQLNTTIIRTKQMTIFETVVDTTPVFRSFLLQFLMRTNQEIVFQHVSNLLQEVDREPGQKGNRNHELEMCLMLVQCIEDSLLEQSSNFYQDYEGEKKFVLTLLSNVIENIEKCPRVIEKIQCVATARFCLQCSAKYIKECYLNAADSYSSLHDEVFRMTARLCKTPIKSIRFFLLTHICRSYGLDVYQYLLTSNFKWVFPSEKGPEKVQTCPDYCVALGGKYREIRDDVAKILLFGNERITLKITEKSNSWQIFYLLALIREMNLEKLARKENLKMHSPFVEELKREFNRIDFQVVLQFMDKILQDSFAKSVNQFQLQFHHNIRGQGIVMLLLHFGFVLESLKSKEMFLPLIALTTSPKSLKDSFLPTMPEEALSQEIKLELQKMEEAANKIYHKLTWYRCRNGHLYAVGNCGNPREDGKCLECKAPIGGKHSKLRDDNSKDEGTDLSKPGHVLGPASSRSTNAISERSLSPSSSILLRFITHMAMLIGANDHLEDVCELVRPKIPTESVSEFLWSHLSKDIDTLQASMDRSLDDIFMFLHTIIHSFVEDGTEKEIKMHGNFSWSTKEGRSNWEKYMDQHYLYIKLKESQKFLEKCGDMLLQDKSIGNDPILKMVFETTSNSECQFSPLTMEKSPSVWQHRTKVTFDHFLHEFHGVKDKQMNAIQNPYLVLETFLRLEFGLSLLRYIPSILQMQRNLMNKYGKKITREEAENKTLQDCLEDLANDPVQCDVAKGMKSFCEVWNTIRHSLQTFGEVNKELKDLLERDIKEDTVSIRVVLPDTRGVGACSRILLEFLVSNQNEFVRTCGSRINTRSSTAKALAVKDIAPIHLICFKREADIVPVVLANCNYTYMQDENTKLEYDFENIQTVLVDRFLFGKPVLDIEFPAMVYKAEATLSKRFSSLGDKIKQVALNCAVQNQIAHEYLDLTDIYETIGNIDVVVNFLLGGSYSKDVQLNSFMAETLQMKALSSSKAAQCCKLSQVQSLWFLLTHEKTKRLHESEKEAFDSMNSSIQENLSIEADQKLNAYLHGLPIEKLEDLMEQLMECILFLLNCGEDDIESYQHGLADYLLFHLEYPIYPEVDLRSLTPGDLKPLPEGILAVHSVNVWKNIHRIVQQSKISSQI